jgi:hypothetical protein
LWLLLDHLAEFFEDNDQQIEQTKPKSTVQLSIDYNSQHKLSILVQHCVQLHIH